MTNAAWVSAFGLAIFGEHWIGPMAKGLGLNRRTLQRVRVAALEDEENTQAAGVRSVILDAIKPFTG